MRLKLQGVLLLLVLASTSKALEPISYIDFDEEIYSGPAYEQVGGQYIGNFQFPEGIRGNSGISYDSQLTGNQLGEEHSLSWWAKCKNTRQSLNGAGSIRFAIGFEGSLRFRFRSFLEYGAELNRWYHFVCVRENGLNYVYLDGVLKHVDNGAAWSIVRAPHQIQLDEYSEYAYALTQEEILYLYGSGYPQRPGSIYQGESRPIKFYIDDVLINSFQTTEQFKGYFLEYAFPDGVSWDAVTVFFDNFLLVDTNQTGTVSDVPIEFQNFVLVVLGIFAGFTLAKILTDNLFPK